MTRIETLRQKYDRYIRTGNHVKALQVMQEVARLSAVHETVERTTVRDLYEALSPADKEKATDLCTEIMLFADLLQSASVDLQGIIHRADHGADLLLYQDVKQIVRFSNNIIRNVDAFHDEEFSYTFGDMADHASLTLDNLIYTEQAKEKRKNT